MSQITFAMRHLIQSEWLFRWQTTVIAALVGGSLAAALLNIVAATGLATAQRALVLASPTLRRSTHRA